MARTTDTPHPSASTATSSPPDTDADLARLQSHLGLPATGHFPTTPLAFLQLYLDLIPPSLTHVLSRATTPAERSRVRGIKSRRMIWAGLVGHRPTRPRELSAEEGWRRWPLLWERSGGDSRGPGMMREELDGGQEYASRPVEMVRGIRVRDREAAGSAAGGRKTEGLFGAMDDDDDGDGKDHPHMSSIPLNGPPPRATTPPTAAPPAPTQSARLSEESSWPSTSFMPSAPRSLALQVNRLGSLMRDLEEEREAQDVVVARQRERRELTDTGERGWQGLPPRSGQTTDEHEVVETFERALLELFLDGKDTLPYDIIDFADPVGGNPLLEQDTADAYFDDEDEVDLSTGEDKGKEGELAEGEYDY
ncbi:hypothetical protein NliqN6_2815 [Naganishia liquefaciens]|uniref:CCD97-like C-terminal domain-containing protein n=1 Tax=Naganishia liquefaciens TaxID=104408 RepID=A0A8H3TSP3_9TREE|nr:hypothetical protein NliqN6_2815 [Naganishia liquefaciens]